MGSSPRKRPARKTPIVRLTGEVVDHLHLTLEDDDEVVGGIARPKEDLPDLRLPRLPIAPEDLDLVFPQRWGSRTADLIGSIIHGVTSSVALFSQV
jgi:hypothetical protein